MTAMDPQPSSPQPLVLNSVPPPAPPPPPGCPGSIQLPNWRSEPLPVHLAPTKEQIEKEQYAHLPDKLLNTLNKDKKPFTYTPSGVSGTEKGKLDLSSIRSPRMKKRLLANLADNEEEDQFERVTRSETPEVTTKQKPDIRRAITPDMSTNKQMYAPVLPPMEALKERPVVKKYKSEEELEAYVQKQMKEIENSLKSQKNQFEDLEPEVKELIDNYKNVQHMSNIPTVEVQPEPMYTSSIPKQMPISSQSQQREVMVEHEFTETDESTKPAVFETKYNNLDYNRNPRNEIKDKNNGIYCRDSNDNKRDININKNTNNNHNSYNPWDSDLLRHVLDGGLQEEIEKFERMSLETQHSFANPKRNDYYERESTPTFDTFGRSLPNPSPVWSPYSNSSSDSYSNQYQTPSPYGSLDRNSVRSDFKSPQPFQSHYQSVKTARQFWSESPSPSPNQYYERETASVEPIYRGDHIPSNQYMKQKSGFMHSEAPNYNSRPKPFYLCSPPRTPTPTPSPPAQFMPTKQPIQRPKEQQFTTFGKNISPQKVNFQNEISNSGMDSMPQTKYIDNLGMYAQTTNADEWNRTTSPPNSRPVDKNITFSDRIITSPERSTTKTPEPPKPILKKKLPPSEQPPDPTPPKYMGGNIPSRSFRVLQLITGEDIDNQFINNDNEIKTAPKSKTFNKSVRYSNYEDFGTDF